MAFPDTDAPQMRPVSTLHMKKKSSAKLYHLAGVEQLQVVELACESSPSDPRAHVFLSFNIKVLF